ncbi:MAG: ferritin-like domain-containing protein [Fimbriimonadales bacterium]|nr:ferritin-like domain-containing protein [Fimbriimonadales bacterium]
MATKEALIEGLNVDLANEYQAIITYITYAATVTGIYREEMKEFFLREVPDELRHAQFLASKVAALGGSPTTTPIPVPPANDLKQMLENVLRAEVETIERYKQRLRQAEELGDYGLANDLQQIISEETQHKESVEMILRGL